MEKTIIFLTKAFPSPFQTIKLIKRLY